MPTVNHRQISSADTRRSATQGLLVIDSVPVGGLDSQIGQSLLDAGALNVAGVYSCIVDTYDWEAIEVHLMPSAVTATVTPALRRMWANRQEVRASATGAVAFVAAANQTLSLTPLTGSLRCRVDITVGAGGSVTFAPGTSLTAPTARGEFNGA